jgi:hypothetical protein
VLVKVAVAVVIVLPQTAPAAFLTAAILVAAAVEKAVLTGGRMLVTERKVRLEFYGAMVEHFLRLM